MTTWEGVHAPKAVTMKHYSAKLTFSTIAIASVHVATVYTVY